MSQKVNRAVAIVGVGAVLPDAPDATAFWDNITSARYSISDVPAGRWDPELYFDSDPSVPDMTYSKIGGWVTDWQWDPMGWRLPIPPKVSDAMDRSQIWSIVAAREALSDYGHPDRPLDGDRTAVVLGNAMGGDKHYDTALRIYIAEYVEELRQSSSFASLDAGLQQAIVDEFRARVADRIPDISEDTMPGELANITAGRIANLFDFHGPNFVTDAACASALAGMDAAIEGLENGDYDAVLTGGVDANMSASTFVKFCKIGALSATGTRPYGTGADGFVMGEGTAMFLLKRLEDAERDGDRIYAVVRGLAGSSDGRGKGITAPNPVGQKIAVQRAWENASSRPDTATLIEGHGTSTRVGDVVEVESISDVFSSLGLPTGSIPLGSVKSNIGHLKAAAGAAGMLKATYALHHKVLPPSLNADTPNPNIDFGNSPLFVNTELQEWKASPGQVRQAGISAFGFGGTNFHVVLEEYIPGRIRTNDRSVTYSLAGSEPSQPTPAEAKAPLRGALVVGADSLVDIANRLRSIADDARSGATPPVTAPHRADLSAAHRVAIDWGDADELVSKIERTVAAIESDNDAAWQMLSNQGVFRGSGSAGHVAFLYTGQGSQYVNMLDTLRDTEAVVGETFVEADVVMEPILGKPLSDYIFIDTDDADAVAASEVDLMQTEITQPAVLTVDRALTALLAQYGIAPDMVMGHSLGEYGALVAARALPFPDALKAVAGRGREMANVEVDDRGLMAAVFAPLDEIETVVDETDGYVVVANVNSHHQAVIGGASDAVRSAMGRLGEAGHQVIQLPVSHAFHTQIVAPASEPLQEMLGRLDLRSPAIPLVANVDGSFYPTGPQVEDEMIDILGKQIASPVQFVKGLETLYGAGARVFVEVGPKKALQGLAADVLGDRGVRSLFTNHPKQGDIVSFNQALCGLYAEGLGTAIDDAEAPTPPAADAAVAPAPAPAVPAEPKVPAAAAPASAPAVPATPAVVPGPAPSYDQLGHLLADFLDNAYAMYQGTPAPAPRPSAPERPVVVTGAGIGLPGMERVFDPEALSKLLHGEQFIDSIPVKHRQEIVDHHITRLVKSEAGGGHFETIDTQADVIKLAGRGGTVDLVEEFGFPKDRIPALDRSSTLAIGAGIDALADAGIPLVMKYKTATTGAQIPERWMLPEAMRDDTGVIFASAFPGADSLIDEVTRFNEDKAKHERLDELRQLRSRADGVLAEDLDRRIGELEADIGENGYLFDRRFLYRGLSFAHAQFAEYIGARGPNTQINSACASTTQAVSLAEDWIRNGRCARVIIISADDVTTDTLLGWIGSGFLAVGAAATDEIVEEAAVPFDRRRHGMILGMGAAALVVESAESSADRGLQPIAEVLSAVSANSAFHGSRLDPSHIREVMEGLVSTAEARWGIDRHAIAPETMFVSHETYTPARGGSAQAEVDALRHVFDGRADDIIITNTKGYTGHAMGTGVEDVLAIKAMETGLVPRVPNFKEVDPDLGRLNLSQGGMYPVKYGLRLGAGFGSQIAMTLYRAVPSPLGGRHPEVGQLGFEYRVTNPAQWAAWLADVTGYDRPAVEVSSRTLRVADQGAPQRSPAASRQISDVRSQMSATAPPTAQTPVAPAAAVAAASPVTEASAPAPAAAAPAPASPAPPAASDPVADQVLAIVAAETGYPPEMLDLDLDLEADLGIDTVKQAEMFAAIRSEWDIERDDNIALRDYPTLRAVIAFVREKRPDLEQMSDVRSQISDGASASAGAEAASDPVADTVLSIVAGETGYPPEMLDLDLDLEADLGIDTVKQAEMFAAIRGEWDIERDDNIALRDYPTLRAVIGFVREKRPDLAAAPVVAPNLTAAAPAVAAPAPTASDPVADKVLAIVAGETGYPPEMLDLDLDLEADLGIDTVKQAEMFAAIRSEWDIERDDNIALRDYPTLRAVIAFVREKRPDLEQISDVASADAEVAVAAQSPATASDPVADTVLAIVANETGYPPEMLDLDLDLEADLGIDTVKQAEMFAAIRSEWDIERDDNIALRDYPTLRAVIGFVYEKRPDLAAVPAAAPAAAPAAPAAVPAAPAPAAADPVADTVLAIVAGETGYPPEMLDLDLDLEADLGIDTVKQAEMFAAIRSEWDIERDDNLALRDYPTLRAVIGFVYEKRPDLEQMSGVASADAEVAVAAQPQEPTAPSPQLVVDDGEGGVLERRVPVPLARPALELCAPTGVSLDEGAKVLVTQDVGGVGAALVDRLTKRGVDVLAIDDAPDADELRDRIDAWKGDDSVTGVYWLPALDVEAGIDDMDLAGWREALRIRVKLLFETMRYCYEDIASEGTFLVSATRMGGRFGFDEDGPSAPMGGAVSGFTKTFKREHPDALVKVVDLVPSRKTAALADVLIDETLADAGPVEVGRTEDGMRWTLGLAIEDLPAEATGMELGGDSVFVVTGAAGSIVSAITADLAAASSGTFHLLDLVPEPDRASEDLSLYRRDQDALRLQIFERLKAAGERATPAVVEKEVAGLERASAALDAIEAIEAAGGTAHYHSVNLLDGESMSSAMATIAEMHDRVDVLLHAGGLEISRLLPDKERSEYDLVFDVKADGWFNLLRGLADTPIGATVAFSSIAGRFGNAGQSDYSAANDLLCKYSLSFRGTRPETTGIAIDWTAWGDIGMATRGSIPTIMKAAGIDMLPAALGVPFIRNELVGASGSREMLVAQRLGMLMEEWHGTGGVDPDTLSERIEASVMIDTVESFGVHTGLTTSVTLEPTEQGFLFDHRIDGTPVLPGVMGVESFAEAAGLPWAALVVTAVEDVEFLAPFKFYKDEPRTVTVHTRFLPDGDGLVAECRLTGSRTLPTSPDPVVTTHFTGRVRLRPERSELEDTSVPEDTGGVGADDLYEVYFHGPAYRVLDHAWRAGDLVGGALAEGLPPNHEPESQVTVSGPRLLELCFQTAGAYEIGTTGTMALPMRIGRVTYGTGELTDSGPATAVVTESDDGFVAEVVGEGGTLMLLEGYRTVRLPGGIDEAAVAPIRDAMEHDA